MQHPINFIKDYMSDVWDSLHWYQKVFLSSVCKIQDLKEQFISITPKRWECINCGREFNSTQFRREFNIAQLRGSGKTIQDMARIIRGMCCSDECFHEYWKKLWSEM